MAGRQRTYDGHGRLEEGQGRPLDLRLPPTDAPDLPPPSELERLGDAYAILSLDARRQVIELFRPALNQLGVLTNGALADTRPGRVRIGGLVVTRQHPMTARGTVFLALEDETGMVNVTLWPDTWARFRQTVRRHALLYIEGRLERESEVVNVIADRVESLAEMARAAGGPSQPNGVRHMGHAGMRRVGLSPRSFRSASCRCSALPGAPRGAWRAPWLPGRRGACRPFSCILRRKSRYHAANAAASVPITRYRSRCTRRPP